MTSRINIEKAILGAVIYCDAYPQVAHILTPKNFSSAPGVKHRELFGTVAGLFPARPIDLITVSHELRTKFPGDNEVTDLLYDISNIAAASNVSYWAFMLLQIDISEKYKSQVLAWKDLRDREMEHVESAALLEIIETIDTQADIFDVIEKSIQYFQRENMTYEYNGAREYFQGIAQRAKGIERIASIDAAMRHLLSTTKCANSQVEIHCEAFAKAIADMIRTGQVNDRYTTALNIIYE